MRLQCPNCDAEYEVDDAAIPQDGRDVQCSNCGHGWFQTHPDYAPDYEMEAALYDPPPPLPKSAPAEGVLPKREIDPAALQILREEAAREEAIRAAESSASHAKPIAAGADDRAGLDNTSVMDALPATMSEENPFSEVDLAQNANMTFAAGMDAELNTSRAAVARAAQPVTHRRLASLRGEDADKGMPPPQEKLTASSRPPIGPNTPPTANYDDNDDNDDHLSNRINAPNNAGKHARRAGIYSAVFLAMLVALIYAFAPEIAGHVPQLAPILSEYVHIINILRDQIQTAVPALMQFVSSALQAGKEWLTAQGWI